MTRGKKDSPDEVDELVEFDPQQKQVERWRLHVLSEAGYPYAVAQRIAMSAADIHVACEILKAGCSPEIAADILL